MDELKIVSIPFEPYSYIFTEDSIHTREIRSWLDQTVPNLYVVTGENIITFVDKKAQTMFLLRWKDM